MGHEDWAESRKQKFPFALASLVSSPHEAQIFPFFPWLIIWGTSVGFSESTAILYDQK
jgi:hypothetical protein